MAGKAKLTPREEEFCRQWLILMDASKAAREAGYSAKTAAQTGYKLLQKPKIKARIEELRQDVAEAVGLTPHMLAAELKRLALSDMADFVTWGPNGVRLKHSDDEGLDTRCVAEVSETVGAQGGGSMRIKLHDKKGAIDSLTKMMGWVAPDKTEITGKDGGPIEVTDAKQRLAERLSRLAARSDPGGAG